MMVLKDIALNQERYQHPYIQHNSKFVSIPKDELDPHTITLDEAIVLIHAKRKADAEKTIKLFEQDENVQVLNGRWGPYIKAAKRNIKIPKDKDPASLTYEECLELIENAPPPRRRKPKPRGGSSRSGVFGFTGAIGRARTDRSD